MTFSICAFDPETGELGIAVQSKFLAVGAVVPWARAGVGAIATQAHANTSYGPHGLELLASGLAPEAVVDRLVREDPDREKRQFGMVDAKGRAATFTGSECFEWAGGVTGPGYCAQGNILAGPAVVAGLARGFEDARGTLADRLVAALHAGQRGGGDRRGMQSAALLVVKEKGGYGGSNDRYIDLRVDDHERPIDELERILGLYKLYFKVGPVSLVAIDDALRAELDSLVARSGQASLQDLFGVENLEERWIDGPSIDEAALRHLRARYPV
ncbi:MAG: DUF1028 domain-containing protein [Candidatus Limnocylindria bacterium]